MTTLTHKQIRDRFRRCYGDDKYQDLVRDITMGLPLKRELLFAKKKRLEAFLHDNPDIQTSITQMPATFWVCYLHDTELVRQRDKLDWTPVRLTDEYEDASRTFPLAARLIKVATDGEPFPHVLSWFMDWRLVGGNQNAQLEEGFFYEMCPDCYAQHNAWVGSHQELAEILVRRVSLQEYIVAYAENRLPEGSNAARMPFNKWDQLCRSEVEAAMSPVTELWEFDSGGWGTGDGFAGLAIVQDGRILKQWVDRAE